MINYSFQKTVHAKCILVGEHAVMRGHSAVVLPIKSKCLSLYYSPSNRLSADIDSPYSDIFLLSFWKVLDTCSKIFSKKNIKISGNFHLKNSIPMGCGMGFSSAICVVVSYWLVSQRLIDSNEIFSFSRKLENIFHGKSSGVDVAGVLADAAVIFNTSNGAKKLKLNWKPYLYVSSSKYSSLTSTCVQQVESIWHRDSELANRIDEQMAQCVFLAEKGLSYNKNEGFDLLAQAFTLANSCFHEWGLIPSEVETHIDSLLSAGAVATKPTGSGGGGYVLSLWKEMPTENLGFDLIPVF